MRSEFKIKIFIIQFNLVITICHLIFNNSVYPLRNNNYLVAVFTIFSVIIVWIGASAVLPHFFMLMCRKTQKDDRRFLFYIWYFIYEYGKSGIEMHSIHDIHWSTMNGKMGNIKIQPNRLP